MNWNKFPNFSAKEFACKHTGRVEMNEQFMERLQRLRTEFGKPMVITSGFRHRTHPIEARKNTIGPHAQGRAADIAVQGEDALRLIGLAIKHGFTGIGVQQKGTGRFIHLDDLPFTTGVPRPTVWSY